jgi:Domain of unknown function (DUF5615)
MLRLLVDEDFNGRIVRGVLRRLPELDLVQVREIGMMSTSDPDLLAQAAVEDRVLLTHDAKTMPAHAYDRVRAGLPMPGLVVCPQQLAIGAAIADVALLVECSEPGEWESKVVYLPM